MLNMLSLKNITMLGWSAAVVFALLFAAYNQYRQSFETARNVANANFDKDQAFRQWASTHGGVYVPVDMNRTPPSPYMSHVPERDITTESGKKLTLMNPAYMLRQMMDEYSGMYGAKGHITALETLSEKNAPDNWERKALEKFKKDSTVKEILELVDIKGESYMRLIRPMAITRGCLDCHAHQATYIDTETAGGVSIIVPMQEIQDLSLGSFKKTLMIYIVFWLAGMLVLRFVFAKEKNARDELNYFANHDILTALPNRHAYNKKIKSIISGDNKQKKFALAFMDIDNFKNINDSLGHTVGDMLLQKVAQRLQKEISGFDMLSRFGGDEFVLIFSYTDSIEVVKKSVMKINEILKEPFALNEFEVYTTASVGVSLYPQDAKDADSLLRKADLAMYKAKKSGRNQYAFYNDESMNLSENSLVLNNELHKALQRDELFLLYQPQVLLSNEKLVGVEALIRWNHPERGLISPVEFIPIAESNGLIIPIGEWVIDQACEQLLSWRDTHMKNISISINISAVQLLHQDLCSYIKNAIQRTNINSSLLELEITETVVMENINETAKILNNLKKLGVTIAIDDFGTGYSSLSYLKKLPIDKLKIDREFIKNIPHDKDDISITKAIINLAKSLCLKIVAEGPETKEHIEFLKEAECDIAQGYYYSKPVSFKDVEKWKQNSAETKY